jgi:hypothetical protein
MKLLALARDIQEQILFLPPLNGLNERNLRRIVSRIEWDEQRRMFLEITDRSQRGADFAALLVQSQCQVAKFPRPE